MVGLEHRTKHINRPFEHQTIWTPNFKKFSIQMFLVFKWSVFRSSKYKISRWCLKVFCRFSLLCPAAWSAATSVGLLLLPNHLLKNCLVSSLFKPVKEKTIVPVFETGCKPVLINVFPGCELLLKPNTNKVTIWIPDATKFGLSSI